MTWERLQPAKAKFAAFFFLVSLFSLYGSVMPFGWPGYILGAFVGAIWALALMSFAGWLEAKRSHRGIAGDATLMLSIAGTAAVAGSGTIYMLVFGSMLGEETATYAVLSAMMEPTVPYFIVLNGALEMLVVPLMLVFNWKAGGWRGGLVLSGALVYWVIRAWTYAVFAEPRTTMSATTLSEADVAWFQETIATDYRVYLAAFACLLLMLAAIQRDLRRSPAG